MTSGDELLNCPFCGGAAEVREWDFPYVRFQARCVECKTTGRTRFNERAKAIAAWNHRTLPTPAAEEREAVARAIAASYYHMDDCELSWQMTAECGEIEAMFRKADAALSALRKTRAAEILAAEARGMGRARTVVQNTRDGMKFDPSATQEWRNAITGGFNAADMALRHELDAMEDFDD